MNSKEECWLKKKCGKYIYYTNLETGKTQAWEKHISNNIKPGSSYYRHIPSLLTQWELPTPKKIVSLPPGWEMHKTKCGNVYYVNTKESISQWEIPILPPRALRWVKNSCYLDSALFAFFAGPADFIEDIINMNFGEEKDHIQKEGICGKDPNNDIINRESVQRELKRIANSINRKGPKVEFCTDLRATLKNCPVEEKYHSGNTGDAGEFMEYLLSIFPTKKTKKKTITYATNEKDKYIDKQKLIQERKLIKTSEIYDYKGSIFITIVEHIVEQIPKKGVKLSKFLKIEDDTGPEENIIFTPETLGGKTFSRRIQINTIEDAPYLIFSVKRLVSEKPRKFVSHPFYPDEYIRVGKNKIFTLSAVVMHTGGCHYVAVAKYGNVWYYYNDIDYLYTNKLIPFNSFNEFIEAAKSQPKVFVNPLSHGTQYYYKPK